MLFIRVRTPGVMYDFGSSDRTTTLWLQGTPTEHLYLPNGEFLKAPISVTLSSDVREHPYQTGSIVCQVPTSDAPADVQLWLCASSEEIEAIYSKCLGAKYTYLSVSDAAFAITDSEWNLDRGNPVAISSYSFRASSTPVFGEQPDLEPKIGAPETPVVVVKESKYTQWLFFIVALIAVILVFKAR